MLEIVAPTVGGVQSSSGAWVAGNQKIGGGPSVLYDAVAILPAANEAEMLAKNPAAREFAADAFTHLKFIAYTDGANPFLKRRESPKIWTKAVSQFPNLLQLRTS
jgi:catalase